MDPLSGIASVLSVADVAVRSCERLRDLVSDLRDAPQSVQRLRRTIRNTESVLRNVCLFVSEFNSSALATVYHEVLPEAVERCLGGIRDDLNLLEKRLAPGDSSGDMWKRMGHVMGKKSIRDILGRLESQQNLLSLALQCAAQRMGIKLYDHDLNHRNELLGIQEKLTNALLDAGKTDKTNVALLEGISDMQKEGLGMQNSLSRAVGDISSSVLNSQVETSAQLNQLHSRLSDRLDQGRTQINGSIDAITKNALIPIVRAELRSIILPAMNHNKSHFDLQMERTRHAIDQIVQSLGHILKERPTVDHHPRTRSPAQPVFQSAPPEEEVRHSQGLNEHEILSLDEFRPSTDLGDQLDTFSRTWTYRLSIGLLCVRVCTSRTRSKDGAQSRAFGRNTSTWSEEVYNLYISFQPARILSNGVSLKTGSRSDQYGHYFRCPEISTFAIIPDGSAVFGAARIGDIQGLKRLFVENLASPTDRDREGYTVLHFAAFHGQPDVCEFLINEGADPCVTNATGRDCLGYMHTYVFTLNSLRCKTRKAASRVMSICAITRLFLRKGCDIHESYQKIMEQHPFLTLFSSAATEVVGQEPIWRDKSHHLNILVQFLHDQNIDVDYQDDSEFYGMTLLQMILLNQIESPASYQTSTDAIFILCTLGANVSAKISNHHLYHGSQPLHLVCLVTCSPEKALYFRAQVAILLNSGADPCAREESHGLTVTQIACSKGWGEQWFRTLYKCNKHEVVIEQLETQIARGKDAPLDNAIRTGVDVTDLSTPSIEGFSRRIAARGDRLDD